MIPFAIDVPPPFFPLIREERRIEFDPHKTGSFSFAPEESPYIPNRQSTSNAPNRAFAPARSIGSLWRAQTSSHTIDRTLAAIEGTHNLTVPGQLAEIKRLTGCSWEQLAALLNCTRQAIHKWNLGEPIANVNRDRLAKLHATIRYIDRGNAEDNRSLLYMSCDGATISEMLAQRHFSAVKEAVGPGTGRPDASWGGTDKQKVAVQDHWYTRLVDSGEPETINVGRTEPQTFRRLQLRKG